MTEVTITFPRLGSHGGGQLRVSVNPPGQELIDQHYVTVTPEPYLVAGGNAEAYPLLLAVSQTRAVAGPVTP